MPIYEKPVHLLIREMIKDFAPKDGTRFSKDDALEWFGQHYPKIKKGTILAHLTRFSTNARSRLHYNPKSDEDLLFQVDGSHFRAYEPNTDPAPIHSKSDVATTVNVDEEESNDDPGSAFAYEDDLRDYLADNLQLIESGLRLYQDEGISGIEFPVGAGRRIDVLAVDEHNNLVVIELKVARAYDRVIGQLLRYMGWIKRNHAEEGQTVRGIIAGREISEDLILACADQPNVSLYEYRLSVTLKQVRTS